MRPWARHTKAHAKISGRRLPLTRRDRHLEIVPAPTPMKLADDGDGVVAGVEGDMPVLTTDMVRETLERSRR
jgi:hypothetical protein